MLGSGKLDEGWPGVWNYQQEIIPTLYFLAGKFFLLSTVIQEADYEMQFKQLPWKNIGYDRTRHSFSLEKQAMITNKHWRKNWYFACAVELVTMIADEN